MPNIYLVFYTIYHTHAHFRYRYMCVYIYCTYICLGVGGGLLIHFPIPLTLLP